MCGIAGIVGRVGKPNRDALKYINDAMAHRGPDGHGYWAASPDERGWGLMLAHRRLSILDLSSSAAQPMVDKATGQVMVFNGEIYNYRELRDKLVAEGHRFNSTGDTAVLLRALSTHGRQAICWLRGMFAFGLWNPNERKLLLARDPLGIKPLYFAQNPDPEGEWSLVFASEVRAILASGLLGKPKLNPHAAPSIVWNGFMMAPETAVQGIKSICPGQFHIFDASGKEESSEFYWTIPGDQLTVNEQSIAGVLADAVRAHLASDVPLGVFLSSGVDSASVANLAHKTSHGPIHTFTLACEEAEYNEGKAARRIAKAIGTVHQEVLLTEPRFMAQLDAALDSLDQPTFDGLNSFYMSQAVRDAGFKVALVGTGGDELFGGYASFRDLRILFHCSRYAKWIPPGIAQALTKWVSQTRQPSREEVPRQTRWAKLPEMVRHGDDLLTMYQLAYALFLPDFQGQLLTGEAIDRVQEGLPAAMRSRLLSEMHLRSPLSAISVLEQRLFLGERVLRDTDSASMAASIEIRLPLVDQLVVENVNQLDERERYYPLGMKSVLRRVGLSGLDPALFERPKRGFVLPFDRWLRKGKSLANVMDQTMRDPYAVKPTGLNPEMVRRLWQAFLDGAPGLYWSRVWAIFVLVRWCHRHKAYL